MGIRLEIILVFACLLHAVCATGRTWSGGGDGRSWSDANNWNPSDNIPQAGEDTTIAGPAAVLLAASSAALNSFTLTNATLIFTNWSACLQAVDVAIRNGGICAVPGAFTNGQMSNRVHFLCTNFILDAGGRIDVDGGGYAATNGPGAGQDYGSYGGSGGGHGGRGGPAYGLLAGGNFYGSTNAPECPGSGGGNYLSNLGGAGGGAVRIDAAADVTINGTISACASNVVGMYAGGGAGGSIWISCPGAFHGGTGGILRANGGVAYDSSHGAGGGGRIAVGHGPGTDARVRFWTQPGTTGWFTKSGATNWFEYEQLLGTVYLPDRTMLGSVVDQFHHAHVLIPDSGTWAHNTLAVSGVVALAAYPGGSFPVQITNDLIVGGGGTLALGSASIGQASNMALAVGGNLALLNGDLVLNTWGEATNSRLLVGGDTLMNTGAVKVGHLSWVSLPRLDFGGDVTLTNGAMLYVYSGPSNAAEQAGGTLSVTGDLFIGNASWLMPYAHPTNGGAVAVTVRGRATIAGGGGIMANGMGFAKQTGLGRGTGDGGYGGSGGGYGGKGGGCYDDYYPGGSANGSSNAPILPGSGGGAYSSGFSPPSGWGGGVIRVEVNGECRIDGTLSANGASGSLNNYDGGGAGGSILLVCNSQFAGGTGAVLQAKGGDKGSSNQGGGGGGRIAVWLQLPNNIQTQLMNSQVPEIVRIGGSNQFYLGAASITNGASQKAAPDSQAAYPGTLEFITLPRIGGFMILME